MKTKQELFLEIDRFFNSDGPSPTPESIRFFFEWLTFPDPNVPHFEAVRAAARRVIADMSVTIEDFQSRAHRARMIDTLGHYYELRADIYQEMDQYYRSWWDKLMDQIISRGVCK